MAKESFEQFFSALDTAISTIEKSEITQGKAGVVRSAKDGIIAIEGIADLRMGEIVNIKEAGVDAMVVEIDKHVTMAVALQQAIEIKTGQSVASTGKILSINASNDIVGRIVDPLGIALDGKGDVKKGEMMPLEAPAPDVMSRQSVSQPLQTGILAIDALIPIGRGQRELIIGDRQTGKTSVALDTILNQKGQNIKCIYVAVGQRDSKTTQVIKTLEEGGALDYTTVVSASASSSAIMQFLAPYAGVAIAEYFMSKGEDALVIYDDLSKHAVAYREMSLLLRKPPGREAYPGDVFYIHSRLLERAAKLNEAKGGGSITALPIIETLAGDVSAYIPTNVISITDGQIFLESGLFNKGIRPAINVGISVSRVGSAAQTKIMKKVSGTAKLDLAQYYELEAFSQFASELDEESKKKLTRGERVVESLKQKESKPRPLWQQVVILWTVMHGFLDTVKKSEVLSAIDALLAAVETDGATLIKDIEEKKELSDEIAEQIRTIVEKQFSK